MYSSLKYQTIVFFDFDGTITSKDTLQEMLIYIKGSRNYYLGLLYLSPILLAYKLRLLPNYKAKRILLTFFLKGLDEITFNNYCKEFVCTHLSKLIRTKAVEEIKKHIKNDHKVVVVSASPENWVALWCHQYDIDCIATKLEVCNSKLTGNLYGKNCHGIEKVDRIKSIYDLSKFESIIAYGDTNGDKPMLKLATKKHYRPFR